MSFVPPPPPGVVVPLPPAATVPAKIVKPGGVALDMSDLFGPPKTGAKKALPPWERKKKTPPPGGPPGSQDSPLAPPTRTVAATTSTPVPTPTMPQSAPSNLIFKSTAETSYPSLSSLPPTAKPEAGANAPVAAVRKSIPTAALAASISHLNAPVSLPAAPVQTTATAPPVAAAVPSPTVPTASLPAVVTVPATANAAPQPTSTPAVGVPPVYSLPTYPATAATATPAATAPQQSASVMGAAAPSMNTTQAPPPLPGSDPAALVASARIVEAALRDMRMHLATPSRTVVAPHVVFRGREQKVEVMPLGPVPPRRRAGQKPTATSVTSHSSNGWSNAFDLRPSPSWQPAHHPAQPLAARSAAATSTKRAQRGSYFEHVDVHRYIARRYFGEAPPVEH